MLALVSAMGVPSCDTNLMHTALSGILIPTECTPGLRSGLRCEFRSNISVNGPGRRSFNISSPTEQFAHLYKTDLKPYCNHQTIRIQISLSTHIQYEVNTSVFKLHSPVLVIRVEI